MTITYSENANGQEFTISKSGVKTIRNYKRSFQCFTTDPSDTQVDIQSYFRNNVIDIGDSMPGDAGSRCSNISVQLQAITANNTCASIWTVTADYSSERTETSPLPFYPYTPAKYSGSNDKEERVLEYDRKGEPVVNTAKDNFDPPLTQVFPIPTLSIQVNLLASSFNPESWNNYYFNALNSSSYQGYSKGCARMDDMSWTYETYETESGTTYNYYAVNFRIAFNVLGWQPKLLSAGYRELYDSNGTKRKRPICINGKEITSPLPLDKNGVALTGSDVSRAHYITFETHSYADFNRLNF